MRADGRIYKSKAAATGRQRLRLPFLESAPRHVHDAGSPRANIPGTGKKGAVDKIKCEALLRAQEFRVTGPPVAPAAEDNPSPKVASSKGSQAEW
jgi:hypothetical protein